MKRTIRKTKEAKWLGNGFGMDTATYGLFEGEKEIARIDHLGTRWKAVFFDGRPPISRDYLRDLRRDLLATPHH